LESLKTMRRKLGRDTGGMTRKNRQLILLLEDEKILIAFLALADRVSASARRSELSFARRAQQMQIAVAAGILCALPLRLKNLATLELGKQLTRPSGPDGPMHLILESAEVKNGREMHFEVPVEVARLIDEYLTYYRPRLAPRASQYLFIHHGGVRKPEGALRDGITKAVRKHVGIHVTPHQYRHIAAELYLRAHPGEYVVVQQLLGHKSIKTTLSFYAREQARAAGRLYDEALAAYRHPQRSK
jgi:integrase